MDEVLNQYRACRDREEGSSNFKRTLPFQNPSSHLLDILDFFLFK